MDSTYREYNIFLVHTLHAPTILNIKKTSASRSASTVDKTSKEGMRSRCQTPTTILCFYKNSKTRQLLSASEKYQPNLNIKYVAL